MRVLYLILFSIMLTGCAGPSKVFNPSYDRAEIAHLSSEHFGASEKELSEALRPVYRKYGNPYLFVSGQMSSVANPELSRLYGSGQASYKLTPQEHTFWQIDGENLAGHLKPMPAVHMIYDVTEIKRLKQPFATIGSLNKRGSVFTLFEREVEGMIVVTVHQTADLPGKVTFNKIRFFEN
jgi:hypothetical protein